MEKLLGGELATATRAWRDSTARTLQSDTVTAVRSAAPEDSQILLHTNPSSYHCGANAGVDPGHILTVADDVVVPCAGGPALLTPFAARGVEGTVLAANFPVVRGIGGSPGTLAEDVAQAADHGATELRLYHAGLGPTRTCRWWRTRVLGPARLG